MPAAVKRSSEGARRVARPGPRDPRPDPTRDRALAPRSFSCASTVRLERACLPPQARVSSPAEPGHLSSPVHFRITTHRKGQMTKHLLSHMKQNTIAYFALFVALGGTSYASVKIPQAIASTHQAAKSAKAGSRCARHAPERVSGLLSESREVPRGPALECPRRTRRPSAGVPANLVHQGAATGLVKFKSQNVSNCARVCASATDRGSATAGHMTTSNPDPDAIHVLDDERRRQPGRLGLRRGRALRALFEGIQTVLQPAAWAAARKLGASRRRLAWRWQPFPTARGC